MAAGRESLTAQKFEPAINSFNQLLLLRRTASRATRRS